MSDYSISAVINANTANFEKGMKNAQKSVSSLSKSVEGVQKAISNAFKLVGIGASIGAVVKFGKESVQAITEANKTYSILDNTIKVTGAVSWTTLEEMDSLSKKMADSTNYSVTEIQEMQSVLLGFTNIQEGAFEDASNAVLDMATVMGMDLKSAVQTVGKALDDPITGLDSLRRQGFKFTDEQKKELAQLVKNGKQLEAQKIILDSLATSYGGASKVGQTAFARLSHAMDSFKEAVGTQLMPIVEVFTDLGTQSVLHFTDVINKMNFKGIVDGLKAVFPLVKQEIQPIIDYVIELKNSIVASFKSIDLTPFIKILDVVYDVVKKLAIEAFGALKQAIETTKQFFNELIKNLPVDKIIEVINTIVDCCVFLHDEIRKIQKEIGENISNAVNNIWEKIKSLFIASNEALKQSGQNIDSWGALFWSVFNQVFRAFQDVVNGVNALLHGDWETAWLYAKLTVARVAKSITDILSTVMNAFPDFVNKILDGLNFIVKGINKIRKIFGKEELGLFDDFKSTDLAEKWGLNDYIKELEVEILETTGHVADKGVKDIASFTSNSEHKITDFVDTFQKGMNKVEDKTTETGRHFQQTMTQSTENAVKLNSKWSNKLLEQSIQLLEEQEEHDVKSAEMQKKSQEEIYNIKKDYGERIIQLKKRQLEEEMKAELDAEPVEAEKAKIKLYYEKEISRMIHEEQNKRKDDEEETEKKKFSDLIKIAKGYAQNVIAVFTNIRNVLSNIWSGVVSVIGSAFNMLKSAFNTVKDFMDKLFNFDPTETLTNMLEYEDKILTFFTFTMQKIPAFVESALSSIGVLMDKLLSQVDLTQVAKIIEDVINTFAKLAPKIIKQIAKLFTDLVKTAGNVIAQNSDIIVGAIGDIVMTVLDNLPTILKTLATVILTLVKSIGTYINNNAGQIIQDLTDLIGGIVSAIADFVNNGGWKVLLNALLNVFYAINRSIIDNIPSIVDTIIKMLPDIVNAIIAIIIEINKSSVKILKPIAKLVVKIVSSIIDILTNPDMIQSIVEVAIALIEAVMTEIIPQLPKLVIQLVKGLILAFAKINWMSVVKDIFKAFINGIKSLFGIHSPSTLFQSFGSMMVQGLVNGLKNIWGNVSGIFSNLVGNIGNVFSNIGSVIGNAMSKIFDNVSSWVGSIGNKLSSIGSGISSAMGKVGGAISSGVGKVKSFLGFATGTVSAPSGLAVVGERGPELVNFKGGEKVINDRDTKKVLAGGNNTSNSFNITFNNTSQTTAYTVMREMKKYGRELAFNGVL